MFNLEKSEVRLQRAAAAAVIDSLREINLLVASHLEDEPIAIVGMGCRYPGGIVDVETFWRVLEEGIDAVTEGRGSVVCRVFVDGKERASSGIVNGFSKPKTLKVDKLEGARRLILSVTDAGDGNRDALSRCRTQRLDHAGFIGRNDHALGVAAP